MSRGFEIREDWEGKASKLHYKLKLSIVAGDLQLYIDAPYFADTVPSNEDCDDEYSTYARSTGEECGLRHVLLGAYECVSLFIASGIEDVPAESREYIEIILGPHGHYLITGYSGEGDENCDMNMLFEVQPESTIDLTTNRWSVKASIPFFFLPGPGEDPNDDLSLNWLVNFCAVHDMVNTVEGREYLSLVKLPGAIPNFHQLNTFVPLVLSDASSQRLRSMSRASVSMKSVYSNPFGVGAGVGEGGAHLGLDTPSKLQNELNSSIADYVGLERPKRSIIEVLGTFKTIHANSTRDLLAGMMSEKDLKAICAQQLQPGEEIVLCGKYWKRKGWAHRRCLLILTSLPKLIYLDAKAPFTYRGCIDWKMTRPLRPVKTMEERFDVELADGSRIYHFYDDENCGVDKWMDVISEVNSSWKAYLSESLGEYDADVLAAMRVRGKKKDGACFIL